MKKIVFLLFLPILLFSQSKKNSPKKILFTYITKSNFYLNENGVVADTNFIKIEFPNIKYVYKKSEKDSSSSFGFIPKNEFNQEQIDKLMSIYYHTNLIKKYRYNLKLKFVTSKGYFTLDKKHKKLFRSFFGRNYNANYINARKEKLIDDNVSKYFSTFSSNKTDYSLRTITWIDKSKLYGHETYYNKFKNATLTNFVNFNEKLDKHVTPAGYYNNCEFGIELFENIYTLTYLKDIKYK
jgi:hypothetical protein